MSIYALIDCNNFFASCEKVFRPDLKDKPIAVLSSNDGCIIARSAEVKALGLPMAVPLHKVKEIVEMNDIQLFSANFELYGDMSHRVMKILKDFVPRIEIYSIDEAFLLLDDIKLPADSNYTEFGRKIRERILKWTGLPVSVGIAHTKTLCKIANEYSKKRLEFKGVLDLTSNLVDINEILANLDVKDIWGIGFKGADYLKRNGIYTALDFKIADRYWVKKNMSIMAERTHLELNGTACIGLNDNPDTKKGIISSRSFGKEVTTLPEMKQAVASYISKAAEKLRVEDAVASVVYVTIITNKHKEREQQYYATGLTTLSSPTAYTPELVRAGFKVLKDIFKEGHKYKKAMVMLGGIVPEAKIPAGLFDNLEQKQKELFLMKRIDKLNQHLGAAKIKIGVTGFKHRWRVKAERRSPLYTTEWDQLLTVKA